MKVPNKKYPIVEVEWVDACSKYGWDDPQIYSRATTSICKSVGYLCKKNEHEVQVVQSLSDTGGQADSTSIPRKCVVKIRILRK